MQSKPPLLWKTKLITDCKTFCLNLRLSKPTLNCIVQTRFLAIIKGIDKSKSRLTTILSNNTVSQLSKQYLLNDSYTAKWNQYCLQCVTSISQCVIWKIIFKFLTLVTSILSSLWKCPFTWERHAYRHVEILNSQITLARSCNQALIQTLCFLWGSKKIMRQNSLKLWISPDSKHAMSKPELIVGYKLPYLLVYKSTFYDQKVNPKNRPRLILESYTKTWPSSPRN